MKTITLSKEEIDLVKDALDLLIAANHKMMVREPASRENEAINEEIVNENKQIEAIFNKLSK